MNRHRNSIVGVCVLLGFHSAVQAGLTLLDQFNPGDIGGIVSVAYDGANDSVWLYGSFGADIRNYTPTGVFLSSVPRPGESANDADLDITPEVLSMNGTSIPAGSLLLFNGESGSTDIYAVDPTTGVLLETLTASFGLSHVVGGAYHPGRDTFFLVQDRVASGESNKNIVAEIDPSDGSVLNTFKIDSILAGFTVNFGDIEVSAATGNLFIVSSDETQIAEFTPTGGFVQTRDLPVGVSSLSGIALDDAAGEAWVTSSSGVVSRLGGFPLVGDLNADGFVGVDDLNIVLVNWNQNVTPGDLGAGDATGEGFVGVDDLNVVLVNWNNGTPPPPGAGTTIPEPGSMALLGAGGVTLLGRRRRTA